MNEAIERISKVLRGKKALYERLGMSDKTFERKMIDGDWSPPEKKMIEDLDEKIKNL